jgi:hypothetical protein
MSTVADVINWTREEVLDDTDSQKYLWSNTELIHLLNRAINELVKSALPIRDQTTEAIRTIKLISNVGVYALDSRVISVHDARLETNSSFGPLLRTTESVLDKTISDWRSTTGIPSRFCPGAYSGYLSIYPKFDDEGEVTGASNITFNGVTISQVGGDFSDFAVGDEFYVSGTTSNDGYYTVATEGTTSITVTDALVCEANTNAILRKVRDTLLMTVSRLPTARFAVSDITSLTEITDIQEDLIDDLVDGIAKRAFLKPDKYTYFPQKAEYHRGLFEEAKRNAKRKGILLNKPDKTFTIRSGSGIGY